MIYAKNGGLVRIIYLGISLIYWCFTLCGRLLGAKKVILCYHGIRNSDVDAFRKQLETVKNRVVSNNNNYKIKPKFSSPFIVITFDDAFENLVLNALPIINHLNIPVSIYVVTGCIGVPPVWLNGTTHKDESEVLMSKEQIMDMASNNLIEFGSHTHNHFHLPSINSIEIDNEIKKSKNILENITDGKITSLALPHGAYTKEILETVLNSGFKQVLTLDEKLCSYKMNTGVCGRFLIEPSVWPIEFRLTIDGAYSWLYYFRKSIRALKNNGRS